MNEPKREEAASPNGSALSDELGPTAWLVTWQGGEHQYVQAFASEMTAVDKARIMGGTCEPMFSGKVVRHMVEGAWCAGYYDAGYTHDSAYACKKAEECASEFLGPNPI